MRAISLFCVDPRLYLGGIYSANTERRSLFLPLLIEDGFGLSPELAAHRRGWKWPNTRHLIRNLIERQLGVVERVIRELRSRFELSNG